MCLSPTWQVLVRSGLEAINWVDPVSEIAGFGMTETTYGAMITGAVENLTIRTTG